MASGRGIGLHNQLLWERPVLVLLRQKTFSRQDKACSARIEPYLQRRGRDKRAVEKCFGVSR
jgi:hypothetical protein